MKIPFQPTFTCSKSTYQCFPHIETSQLICCANRLTGFYMSTTLALNGLSWQQIPDHLYLWPSISWQQKPDHLDPSAPFSFIELATNTWSSLPFTFYNVATKTWPSRHFSFSKLATKTWSSQHLASTSW